MTDINGTNGDDFLDYSTANDDVEIDGKAGNDTIIGSAFDDELEGGTGDDSIEGRNGDDEIEGNDGNDTLIGGNGDDELEGGDGDDLLDGGAHEDKLEGGDGNDTLIGGSGEDEIKGGNDDDLIDGGAAKDKLEGDDGNDTILGGGGEDDIKGGDGDDSIDGGAAKDKIEGDDGNDTIHGAGGQDDIKGGDGNDVIDGGDGKDKIDGEKGDDTIFGGGGQDEIKGGKGNDVIDGGEGKDKIDGEKGDDTIFGGGGNDEIKAGSDDDVVSGGAGNDELDGEGGTDTAVYAGSILDFDIEKTGSNEYRVTDLNTADGDEGQDELDKFEFLQFSDFTLDIDGGNNAPLITSDGASTDEDSATVLTVEAYDFDGDPLTLDNVTYSALGGGLLTLTSTTALSPVFGTGAAFAFAFDPNGDFDALAAGEQAFETVTITVSDDEGGVTTETFDIVINGVNNGPVANPDSATTDEDTATTIDVLANDTDVDGDMLTVTSASALNGSVSIGAGGVLTYTPAANFNGSDTITYEISDGNGGTATGTVDVTVNPVNDAPVANPDTVTTDEDTAATISVLANDTDVDGDTLTVISASAGNGGVSIGAGGVLTYTPDANFNGSDTITYEISDGNGGTATSTVAVTVNAVNDAPVANPDTATTDEDTATTITVLANDTDVDGDALTVISASAGNGGVSIGAGGVLTYTPDANFNGSDTITYEISDGNGGTATSTVAVTVNPVNDAPVANPDTATVDENDSTTITVLANDTDVDGDTLTVTNASAGNGSVSIGAGGVLTYTPTPDFFGSDTITYEISDGNGGTATSTVAVTVNEVNNAPVANPDSATVDEDSSVNIDVLANDTDLDGDTLTLTSFSADNGTLFLENDHSLTYTPNADYNGPDTITYTISDGNGGTATGTVSITVNPVQDVPVASDDTATVAEDGSVNFDVRANDVDVDGDSLTVVSISSVFEEAALNGTVVIEADGTLTYTPNPDYNGPAAFEYTVSDGNGGTATAIARLSVTPTNDAPIATPAEVNRSEDEGVFQIDLSDFVSDIDVGDTLSISGIGLAAGATSIPFSVIGTSVIEIDAAALGVAEGETLSTDFIYTVSDDSGAANDSAEGRVRVTVTGAEDPPPVNTAPVANAVSIAADEAGGLIAIDLTALATDPDTGDTLTVTALLRDAAPVVFTQTDSQLLIDPTTFFIQGGAFEPIPGDPSDVFLSEGEEAILSLTFDIEDGAGESDSNVITLTLTGDTPGADNTPPTITPPAVGDVIVDATGPGSQVIDLNAITSDVDGDTLTFTVGNLTLGGDDGSIVVDPSAVVFDETSATVTIDLTALDALIEDGAGATGVLDFTVSDGTATVAGQVVTSYVDPFDVPPPDPVQTVLDFEPFADSVGATIPVGLQGDVDFDTTPVVYEGFFFQGTASVIETDELSGGGGRGGSGPAGIASGQTTSGGDNVLVGGPSFRQEPLLDDSGNPVLDRNGDPILQDVVDNQLTLYAEGSTTDVTAPEQGPRFATAGLSQADALALFAVDAPSFNLDGLSLNVTGGGTSEVTITTYTFSVREEPFSGGSPFSNYFLAVEVADTFVFNADDATPAEILDFNDPGFADDAAVPNTNTSGFDAIYAVSFETDDGSQLVLDDILITA